MLELLTNDTDDTVTKIIKKNFIKRFLFQELQSAIVIFLIKIHFLSHNCYHSYDC